MCVQLFARTALQDKVFLHQSSCKTAPCSGSPAMQFSPHICSRCKDSKGRGHVVWVAHVAGCTILDDEFGLPAHAKEHVVVIVASRNLINALPDAVVFCEVKRRPCHWYYLTCGD